MSTLVHNRLIQCSIDYLLRQLLFHSIALYDYFMLVTTLLSACGSSVHALVLCDESSLIKTFIVWIFICVILFVDCRINDPSIFTINHDGFSFSVGTWNPFCLQGRISFSWWRGAGITLCIWTSARPDSKSIWTSTWCTYRSIYTSRAIPG